VFTPSKKTAKILTAASVKRLLAGRKKIEIPDGGSRGTGLRLVIQVSGHKSWSVRFRRPGGKSGNLVLGPVDLSGDEMPHEPVIGQPLTLAGARKLAASVARERALGRDPVADFNSAKRIRKTEREERTANAFAPLARRFIEEHARAKTRTWALSARLLGLKPDTLETIPKGLADRWRVRPVTEITVGDIHDLTDEIRRRGVPGWARRNGGDSVAWVAHARIAKFFSWLQTERRLIAVNPCAAVRRPDASTPRDRVLSDPEVGWFWKAADELGQPFSVLLKLLLLLGQRRAEVAGMRWTELDGDTWTIPAVRVKNKKIHVVPLPQQAQDLISTICSIGSTFVFTTTGASPVSGWSKLKAKVDSKMVELAAKEKAVIPPWTLHDLRRTCASGLQRLGIALPITEKILNHSSGSFRGIVSVYQKHEYLAERRDALEKWAQYVEKLAAET
jgi:integrase